MPQKTCKLRLKLKMYHKCECGCNIQYFPAQVANNNCAFIYTTINESKVNNIVYILKA